MGLLRSIAIGLLSVLAFRLFVRPPLIENPETWNPPPLPKLEGVLEKNTLLSNAKLLHQGILNGPESFDFDDEGYLYVSVKEGRILKSVDNKNWENSSFVTFATTGKLNSSECGSFALETECGRPLGMRFHDGKLYVLGTFHIRCCNCVDAYFGLHAIEKNGTVKHLVSEFEGHRFKFCNDLDISKDGIVYFSDASDKFYRRENAYDVMESRPHGRLFSYNLHTGETKLLLKDLYFANGVQLSPNEEFLIVAETSRARIQKLHLKGPKQGQMELFIDNLPGLPDNIRYDKQNDLYWIGFSGEENELFIQTGKRSQPFALIDFLGPYPTVRYYLVKLVPLELLYRILPRYGLVLAVNSEGKITKSLHDPDGTVCFISEVQQINGTLWIGSFRNGFLVTVPVSL